MSSGEVELGHAAAMAQSKLNTGMIKNGALQEAGEFDTVSPIMEYVLAVALKAEREPIGILSLHNCHYFYFASDRLVFFYFCS